MVTRSFRAAPATDVDTTGSSKEKDPEPEDPTPPEGWTQIPYVQVEGGFVAGVALGLVPFGGVGQQVLDAAEVLPHGTPEARRGLAVGQVVGGLITLVGGLTGEVAGGLATTTGIGAAVGVSTIAVSTTLVVGGAANVAAGIRGLMTTGSGSGPAREVKLPSSKYPASAAHAREAHAAGRPSEVTIDRAGAPARRGESLAGRNKVPGQDLDEYPPAMFKEGGKGASVRPITPRDNRGAGACIGNQCRDLPDGARVKIVVE